MRVRKAVCIEKCPHGLGGGVGISSSRCPAPTLPRRVSGSVHESPVRGQRHYYAHLDRYADIENGQRVRPGTILGYVGTTGNAAGTPPHLHYGIYESGGAIKPYPLLRATAAPARTTTRARQGAAATPFARL